MAFNIQNWEHKGTQLLVTITQDRANTLQVKMGKYTKVVTEQFQTINIAPYLRERLNIEQPIISGKYTDYDAAVPVEVTINGELIESGSSYTLGEYAGAPQCASDLPYRVISQGQTDAITLLVDVACYAELYTDSEYLDYFLNSSTLGSLYAFKVQPKPTEQLYVSLILDDKDISYKQHIPYIFRPMGLNGKRIAWLNRYGAVDFWNFDYLREQSFGATAETIYTHNGYKKIARTAEKVFVVETREATREAIDALSFIIASPAVWVVNDDLTGNPTFEEVDVITEECKVFDSQELIGLQIAYRPKQRVL
jgi:hypothetical protein